MWKIAPSTAARPPRTAAASLSASLSRGDPRSRWPAAGATWRSRRATASARRHPLSKAPACRRVRRGPWQPSYRLPVSPTMRTAPSRNSGLSSLRESGMTTPHSPCLDGFGGCPIPLGYSGVGTSSPIHRRARRVCGPARRRGGIVPGSQHCVSRPQAGTADQSADPGASPFPDEPERRVKSSG